MFIIKLFLLHQYTKVCNRSWHINRSFSKEDATIATEVSSTKNLSKTLFSVEKYPDSSTNLKLHSQTNAKIINKYLKQKRFKDRTLWSLKFLSCSAVEKLSTALNLHGSMFGIATRPVQQHTPEAKVVSLISTIMKR
ncbi:hypothetical protein WA026_013807 [Henosepilachna vigintioctopunctata]|uniref:Uncharacterized protein n=1 Tax=Henosepilachna vigintioctopunctata TaxID=420089 RepID=A0AAW1V230_9CUCU